MRAVNSTGKSEEYVRMTVLRPIPPESKSLMLTGGRWMGEGYFNTEMYCRVCVMTMIVIV